MQRQQARVRGWLVPARARAP
eukprot:COSAG01_NODE_12738_length_1692_cov_1.887633_2_plen_20_part_01